VRAALNSVHGVDLNPFAVAIARFRLLVAAMAASGVRTLAEAAKYDWPVNLAVGDSLIKHRHKQGNLFDGLEEEGADELADFKYETEDVHEHPDILLPGRYHVVVGNPPYITVKDKKLNELYRGLYGACAGAYALSVPFAQRFFELAKIGDVESGLGYGLVGQITANSFMKREFGARLIETYFGHEVELIEVIDTSGAYIPGHGTPTVILVGKRRSGSKRSSTIRTIRSVQGEPTAPKKPEEGLVWKAIREQIDEPGSTSKWVSVDDLERERYFSKHPWILAANALELVEQISVGSQASLGSIAADIGAGAVTREDDAYMVGSGHLRRNAIPNDRWRPLVEGMEIRDYLIWNPTATIWPYSSPDLRPDAPEPVEYALWPYRAVLQGRVAFGKTQLERGLSWFEYSMFFRQRYKARLAIATPEIATHNHFILDRGEKVFKDTAPVITLGEGVEEEEHLRLLGVLNSSTICFWMKAACHNKGGSGLGRGFQDEAWENRYQYKGANLARLPVADGSSAAIATHLDAFAQQLAATSPAALSSAATPTATALHEARGAWHSTRARMIALQEELDWQVYSLYNLHYEDLRVSEDPEDPSIPELALGERAFEIVLARRAAAGEASDEWFKRHNSTPITEIPAHWPAAYREVVQKRIDAIESNRAIGMVERPEYKRRWATEGWDALQEKALRSWLLDRMENRDLWFDENGQPTILTLARLTDALSRDEGFVSVAKLYAPRKELAKVVAELITDEHVPFLSALRYKPSGLKKRADWEEVWDLQRKEDAAPDEPAKRKIRDSIPVPPKYTSADFLRPSYWKARGKLDVPKERFISYGQTNAATPELYGWAGWDHKEQAQALATYFTNTALSTEEITPFLAGLLELQPWLSQWHNEFDMLYSGSPADFFAGYRQQKQGEHGLTDDDLRGWRAPAATRGRRAAAKQ
jgi:hypothetical protein